MMPDSDFVRQVSLAARIVARVELRLRKQRARVVTLEGELREAKRQLRLLAQATEPYTPATPAETAERLDHDL